MLRHAADRRSLALALLHLALAGVVLWLHAWYLVPVLACSAFIQLISTHNAMHTPMFKSKRSNRAWQCLLSICIGYPVSVFVPVHNLSHHLGLQTPRDILRTTEVRHRWNLWNLVHHMVMGTVHLHLLHFAYLATMRHSRPRWFRQVAWEAATVIAWLVGIAIAFGPIPMVMVWVACVIGQLLIVGFGYVQHDGCDPESTYDHSRNFTGALFNWFIFDNGFHAIHHNEPALHWSRCKTEHARVIAGLAHPGLQERSLVAYMWRAFVWPGKRLRFDGAPVVLPEQRAKRELWTPVSAITSGASSGAVEG